LHKKHRPKKQNYADAEEDESKARPAFTSRIGKDEWSDPGRGIVFHFSIYTFALQRDKKTRFAQEPKGHSRLRGEKCDLQFCQGGNSNRRFIEAAPYN
jgi:hypothetical protein